eukprot:6213811-Pleurochrysis_carterae.AAC.2
MAMVDIDKDTVFTILRQTISSSADAGLSILSPVLPNLVTKMTRSNENIDTMLEIIDSIYHDKREHMLPGIMLLGSTPRSCINFSDKNKVWRFFYNVHSKILAVFSDAVMPPLDLKKVRVGSVHDLQAMETSLRDYNVPEPYIESIASVFVEHFESREIRSSHESSVSPPTAPSSLAAHAAQHLLRKHIHELELSDVLNIVDAEVLRKVLVQFLTQDPIANMVRVLRSIPLCFSPVPFPWTMEESRIIGTSDVIVLTQMIELYPGLLRIEFDERLFGRRDSFHKHIRVVQADAQTVTSDLGFNGQWIIEKNEQTKIANTFEFFRRIRISKKMLQWLR